MMRYTDYFTTDDRREEARVSQCLRRTLEIDPGYGPAMAAEIMMRYRYGLSHPEQAAAIRRDSLAWARRAVDADPYSADAQLALAFAAYNNGQCEQGRAVALRALELNPYNSYAQARTGMSMFQCDDPDYEQHLREAWKLDSSLPAITAMPILIGMADRGEGQEALRFANGLPSGEGYRKPGYELTMAVAHAAGGDVASARASWREASAAVAGKPLAPPATILRHIVVNPGLADRTEAYLRRRGVFDR